MKADGWEHPFLLHQSHGDIHTVLYSLAFPLRSLLSRRIQAMGWGGGVEAAPPHTPGHCLGSLNRLCHQKDCF